MQKKQPTIETWPANNLILNCTPFNNSDATGENADGFAAKLTCGNNIFLMVVLLIQIQMMVMIYMQRVIQVLLEQ
ncbi:MAG: hypothetical protein L6U99_12615 [Clostridium sp.]|nr:MAG: hypothetical protein L6U99_12615 [Clostridium sp.]